MTPCSAFGAGGIPCQTHLTSTYSRMANEHPDAPKQFGIRLSNEIMEMVSAIQQFRQSNNQPTTLSSIVEDAIEVYYEDLVESGEIQDEL